MEEMRMASSTSHSVNVNALIDRYRCVEYTEDENCDKLSREFIFCMKFHLRVIRRLNWTIVQCIRNVMPDF